jgi:hypothetical protein
MLSSPVVHPYLDQGLFPCADVPQLAVLHRFSFSSVSVEGPRSDIAPAPGGPHISAQALNKELHTRKGRSVHLHRAPYGRSSHDPGTCDCWQGAEAPGGWGGGKIGDQNWRSTAELARWEHTGKTKSPAGATEVQWLDAVDNSDRPPDSGMPRLPAGKQRWGDAPGAHRRQLVRTNCAARVPTRKWPCAFRCRCGHRSGAGG